MCACVWGGVVADGQGEQRLNFPFQTTRHNELSCLRSRSPEEPRSTPIGRGREAGGGWKPTHEGEIGIPNLLGGLPWETRTCRVLARAEPQAKELAIDA